MEVILASVITGLFGLAAIILQHNLSNRKSRDHKSLDQQEHKLKNSSLSQGISATQRTERQRNQFKQDAVTVQKRHMWLAGFIGGIFGMTAFLIYLSNIGMLYFEGHPVKSLSVIFVSGILGCLPPLILKNRAPGWFYFMLSLTGSFIIMCLIYLGN